MNHFNYGIIIGAIESAPLLGAYNADDSRGMVCVLTVMRYDSRGRRQWRRKDWSRNGLCFDGNAG